MILYFAFRLVLAISYNILNYIGRVTVLPNDFGSVIINFMSTLVSQGAGFLFLFVRPITFFHALDVLFGVWVALPTYYLIRWVLKKLPLLGIS